MIMSKRDDLMESDFSMCLGILMSFKEPSNIVQDILSKAQKVRMCILEGIPF